MNTYAIIRSNDILLLAEKKAPSCAILIYTVLLRFCQNKSSCFPSIKTIREALGNAWNERTTYRNLSWLVVNGFVERKSKSSKERFTIVSRLVQKTKQTLEKIVEAGEKLTSHVSKRQVDHVSKRTHKKKTKDKSYFNNKRKKAKKDFLNNIPVWRTEGNYERFDRSPEPVQTESEKAWADLCIQTHPPCLSAASVPQRAAIINGIRTGELKWVVELYPDILTT